MNFSKQAVFLDRDGVINKKPPEHDYVKSLSEFHLLAKVPEAIKLLNNAGYLVIVISNQRGIARGLVTEGILKDIQDRLDIELAKVTAHIDAYYYCPHDINDHCSCRKPQPGLFRRALSDLLIDPRLSYSIGDSESDREASEAAGIRYLPLTTDGSLVVLIKEKLVA